MALRQGIILDSLLPNKMMCLLAASSAIPNSELRSLRKPTIRHVMEELRLNDGAFITNTSAAHRTHGRGCLESARTDNRALAHCLRDLGLQQNWNAISILESIKSLDRTSDAYFERRQAKDGT